MSSWKQYYDYLTQAGPEQSDAARLYDRAVGKANAVGLDNPEQKKGPGLLAKILSPLDMSRGVVYATLTELADVARGEPFLGEDWQEKYDRARFEGEGFGSTGPLRVESDDNFLTKAAKFGGAFAADVVSDPVNWVTFGTATLGKTAATGLTKTAGRVAFRDLGEVVARRTGQELGTEAVEKLAVRQLAKQELTDPQAVLKVLREGGDDGAKKIAELAADHLGDTIVTGRVAGTARTSRQYLARELADVGVDKADDVALDVLRGQSREIRGGLRVEMPFTRLGFDLTKGGGAVTDAVGVGRAADKVNESRLGLRRALNREGSIKRLFSGEAGDIYGTFLADVAELGPDVLRTPGRTTAGDVAAFMKSRTASRAAGEKVAKAFNAAAQRAQAELDQYGDQEVGRRILNAAFDGSTVELDKVLRTVDAADPQVQKLVAAGNDARGAFRTAAEAMGLEPDEAYRPRIYSAQQAERNINFDPWDVERARTNPGEAVKSHQTLTLDMVDNDPSTWKLTVENRPNMEINAERALRGKPPMFEEDMFTVLAVYGANARAQAETLARVRALDDAGLIAKLDTGKTTTPSELQSAAASALETVRKKAGKRTGKLADDAADAGKAARRANAIRAAAVVDADAERLVLTEQRDALRAELQMAERTRAVAKQNATRAQRTLDRLTTQYRQLGRREGREAEQLRTKIDAARKELAKAEVASRETKARLTAASAAYQAAAEAPLSAGEAARAADRLPGTRRAASARDASVVAKQADLDAAQQAAKDVAAGAGNDAYLAAELDEARADAVAALGDQATTEDVLGRLVPKLREQNKKMNAELMSARYGTKAERRATQLAEKAKQAAVDVEERVRRNAEGNDLLAQALLAVNRVLETGDTAGADRLIGDLFDAYKDAGASAFELRTIQAARDAVNKVPKSLARSDAADTLSALGLKVIRSSGSSTVPQAFAGYAAGGGVAKAITKVYAHNTNNAGVVAALREYVNPIMKLFRTYSTVGSGPGYLARNGIGATINNWLAGVSATRYKVAYDIETTVHRVMAQLDDDIVKGTVKPDAVGRVLEERLRRELSWDVADTGTSAYELTRGFLDQGVQYNRVNDALEKSMTDSIATRTSDVAARDFAVNPTLENLNRKNDGLGLLRSTARRVNDSKVVFDNPWLRMMAGASEREEFFVRMAAYAEGHARYGDEVAAGLFAKSIHFDYQDLTEFEKSIKFLVPFYTWTRYNVPFQMRAAINNPGSIQRLNAFSRNLALAFGSDEDGVLPDWVQERQGFLTGIGLPGSTGQLAVMMETPQLDLLRWGNGNPAALALSSLNPLIKSAVEIGSGRDIETGQKTDALNIVKNVAPPLRQAMRFGGLTEADREKRTASLLSFAGLPVAAVTPTQQDAIVSRRSQELNARVKDALAPYLADGEEIDGDWLVEASRRFTPEQVISLVAQGYGRRGQLDPNTPRRVRTTSNRPSAGTRAAQNIDPAAAYLSQFTGE